MAISGQAIGASIFGQCSASGFTGRDLQSLCSATGNAVFQNVIIPNITTCTLNGTAGPTGTIIHITVLGIVPTAMAGLMNSKAASVGFTGKEMSKLFSAFSRGVSLSLLSMQMTGTVAGCAVGAGTGKFYGLQANALGASIKAQHAAKTLTGKESIKLADIFAFGIATHLAQSATFTVSVAGAIAPVPPAGPVAVASIPSIFTKIV